MPQIVAYSRISLCRQLWSN